MSDDLTDDFVDTIKEHCTDEPIVSSSTVRWVLDKRLGERRNHPGIGFNGGLFRKAEQEACRNGHLQRWKRIIGKEHVGWSPSKARDPAAFGRAEAWARRKGWKRSELK